MKKLSKAALVGVATFFSLSYSIVWIRKLPVTLDIGLRYVLVGLILGGFAYLLMYFNLKYATRVYLVLFGLATFYLILVAVPIAESFRDLGMILTWMILIGAGAIGGLLTELVVWVWKKYKS